MDPQGPKPGIVIDVVGIAQLVSASDCGSEGRGFESHYPPWSCYGCSSFFTMQKPIAPVDAFVCITY